MEGEQLPGLLRTPLTCSCGGWRAQCARAPGLPRFCHELNRPHLIEPVSRTSGRPVSRGSDQLGCHRRDFKSLRLRRKTPGQRAFTLLCREIRHFCHVCEASHAGRSETRSGALVHQPARLRPDRSKIQCRCPRDRERASLGLHGPCEGPVLHSVVFGHAVPSSSDAAIRATSSSRCWPHGNPLLRIRL